MNNESVLSSWCEMVIRTMKGSGGKSVLVKELYKQYVISCVRSDTRTWCSVREMTKCFVEHGCAKRRIGKGLVIRFE